MRIGAIIQARMSSERLYGKVLFRLPYNSNITMLQQVIRRVKRCKMIDDVIVATTEREVDNQIVDVVEKECECFSGSESDVLSRYYLAAKKFDLDMVVRVTGDCPCIDSSIIDRVVGMHLAKNGVDYTSNVVKRTFPRGMDTEVFSANVLEQAYHESVEPYEREHVTPFINRNKIPDRYMIQHVLAENEQSRPDLRLTVDTLQDYALMCCIYDELCDNFALLDIVELFDAKPWLALINKEVVQKQIR